MFLSTDSFPKFKVLERHHVAIGAEIPAFCKGDVTLKRDMKSWYNSEGGKDLVERLQTESKWIASWDDAGVWFNFPLVVNDIPLPHAEAVCPQTISLLKSLGGINVAGFSLLLPKSRLPAHTDGTGPSFGTMAFNMKLTGGLATLHVGGKTHRHMIGKAVIFNSEVPHYAKNDGTSERTLLYIDFKI